MTRQKLPTPAENYSRSLTFIKHFIDNALGQIEKLEISNRTDSRIIESKRRSLNLIIKFVTDSQTYINSLETRKNNKPPTSPNLKSSFKDYFNNFDIDDPGQREAKRYLSIQNTREKWPELY